MSGVCAIWSTGERTDAISRQVQDGLNAMAHRGADGFSIYFEGNAGLGHCLFDTGCNGMYVDQDGFAVSFDGRIDNREALLEHLSSHGGHVQHDTGRLHDKALLLLLYRSLGERLPERLRGDFSIVIWDPDRRILFMCRDHFGVRPLFWYQDETAYYFASEIKALRAMAGLADFPLRDAAAAEFVTGASSQSIEPETIYQGVFRLLPGHFATLDNHGLSPRRFWQLSPCPPFARPGLPERLRELLQQSIDRRLRTGRPVAALLSGGLDSSSIVSLLASGKGKRGLSGIPVYSLVFEQGDDESEYIAAMEAAHDFRARRIDGSEISAFDDCDEIMAEQDQPIPAPNIATFRYFLRTLARESGARIVLDGHGGDEATSYGNGYFAELAESGSWLRLWRELGKCAHFRPDRVREFMRLVRHRGLRAWRKALGRMVHKRPAPHDPVRFTADGRPRPYEQAFHISKLTSPLCTVALESIDHNAAAAGIEVRMPFLDVDLVEFCVTVPADAKWANGMPRALLRQAMAGVLPPMIAARQDKFDFGIRLRSMLARDSCIVAQALHDERHLLSPYADLVKLRESWRSLIEEAIDGHRFHELWRAVMLHRWLKSRCEPRQEHPAASLAMVPAE